MLDYSCLISEIPGDSAVLQSAALVCGKLDCQCHRLYEPSSVPSNCRTVYQCETAGWRGWRASRAAGQAWGEEGGTRVWSLKSGLEGKIGMEATHGFKVNSDQLQRQQTLTKLVEKMAEAVEEEVRLQQVVGTRAAGVVQQAGDCLETDMSREEQEVGERLEVETGLEVEGNEGRRKLVTKPMTFQRLGVEVWRDKEPQSHRAQHPWLLVHTREGTETVRKIMKDVVDPQVEEVRSHCLATTSDTLDLRTEYQTVERTGEMEEFVVGGMRVEWERLRVVTVRREDGPASMAAVKVRRTRRARGFMAGRGEDQERQEDLQKPVLVVSHPCGQNQAISVDFKMSGLDTKMIRILNQRTGSYCYMCKATKEMAHNIERVTAGFWADLLSMEELIKHARELMVATGVEEQEWHEYVLVAVAGDAETRFCSQFLTSDFYVLGLV